MDDLEYRGLLPDGTLFELKLSFRDEGLYRRIVHALEEQRSKGIAEGGLLDVLSNLAKTSSKKESLEYKS